LASPKTVDALNPDVRDNAVRDFSRKIIGVQSLSASKPIVDKYCSSKPPETLADNYE